MNDKYRLLAPILMLFAGAVAYIILLVNGSYSFRDALLILLCVLLVFYVIGLVIQNKIIRFVSENEAKEKAEAEKEGAVIEKEAPAPENEGGEGNAAPEENGEAEGDR